MALASVDFFILFAFTELFFDQQVGNQCNIFDMDWINCNSCCRQPGDERERKFMLTNCGHIFCDICLSQGKEPRSQH